MNSCSATLIGLAVIWTSQMFSKVSMTLVDPRLAQLGSKALVAD